MKKNGGHMIEMILKKYSQRTGVPGEILTSIGDMAFPKWKLPKWEKERKRKEKAIVHERKN